MTAIVFCPLPGRMAILIMRQTPCGLRTTTTAEQAWRLLNMSSDAIVHVTDASFADEVLNAKTPVLVDFWAAWCGPCKMIAPILDDLAGQYEGKLKIAKVDVDANKETPGKFNIRGIPTLIIFKDGNVEATKVGALSRTQLIDFIDSVV
jgi:thioredoxin 1